MGALAFFSTRGRVSRGRFWLVGAILFGALFLTACIGVGVVAAFEMPSATLDLGLVTFTFEPTGLSFVISRWMVVLFLPLAIKRLHDQGRSGWRLGAFALGLFFLFLVTRLESAISAGRATITVTPPLSPAGEATVAWFAASAPLAAVAVTVWCLLELACLSGTVGDNRYGADPKLRKVNGREGFAQPISA